MTNYIERYWRDATPQDAIKEPPMVARFRDNIDNSWSIHKLNHWDRSDDPWVNESGYGYDCCQVYDAPDPGEGYELIDICKTQKQEGDEYLHSSGVWKKADQLSFRPPNVYRRPITPTVTYVPFTWEDREQLRGRWVYRDKDSYVLEEVAFEFDSRDFDVVAKHLLDDGWKFLDTGEPVGRKVTQ